MDNTTIVCTVSFLLDTPEDTRDSHFVDVTVKQFLLPILIVILFFSLFIYNGVVKDKKITSHVMSEGKEQTSPAHSTQHSHILPSRYDSNCIFGLIFLFTLTSLNKKKSL